MCTQCCAKFRHPKMRWASMKLLLSLIIFGSYILWSCCVVWLLKDCSSFYSVALYEEKTSITQSCLHLLQESCPRPSEKGESANEFITKATLWRETCELKINQTELKQKSDTLERRVAVMAVEQMRRTDSWKDHLGSVTLDRCTEWDRLGSYGPTCLVHWLLSRYVEVYWIVVAIMLAISGILLYCLTIQIYYQDWNEQFARKIQQRSDTDTSSSSISLHDDDARIAPNHQPHFTSTTNNASWLPKQPEEIKEQQSNGLRYRSHTNSLLNTLPVNLPPRKLNVA